MDGVTESIARGALRLAAFKLPVKTKFAIKGQEDVEQTVASEEIKNES